VHVLPRRWAHVPDAPPFVEIHTYVSVALVFVSQPVGTGCRVARVAHWPRGGIRGLHVVALSAARSLVGILIRFRTARIVVSS
jgi:hypothetical protein